MSNISVTTAYPAYSYISLGVTVPSFFFLSVLLCASAFRIHQYATFPGQYDIYIYIYMEEQESTVAIMVDPELGKFV